MNVLTVILISGTIFTTIGLFLGGCCRNAKLNDIVSENYDLQKENERLREENKKLNDLRKITISSNAMIITKENTGYQSICGDEDSIAFRNGFCDEL